MIYALEVNPKLSMGSVQVRCVTEAMALVFQNGGMIFFLTLLKHQGAQALGSNGES